MDEETATLELEPIRKTWLCVLGFHDWGSYKTETLTEEIKGYYKKTIPVRVVSCGRCALLKVQSLA